MPSAAPIIGAAVSAFSIKGGVLLFSWKAFAVSLVLGGLSYALTPKPKRPPSQGAIGQTIALKQPDLTRQYVYGHTRVSRGYAHMESTGLNGRLHLILMLCEGPIRAINEIWVNDYAIPNDWIDGDGNVTQGRYAGKMVIRKHLGATDQVADSLAVSNMVDWTSDHRLQGIAYLYIILDKDQDLYPNGLPNFSAIVEGMEVYDPRIDGNTWSTNIALYASDFITSSRYGFGASTDDVDYTNVSAEANICDEIVDTLSVAAQVSSVDDSTDIITLGGDVLEFEFGDRVLVSSTGSLPTGLSVDTPYYVIPYQVKDTPRILLAASLDDAMDKTAIDLTSAGSGTITVTKTGEPRYHGSGIIDSETDLQPTLNNIVNSMAGRAVNIGGFWTLLAGAWRAPQTTFTIDDIRGDGFGLKTALSMSESFNVVKGLFTSPLTLYQPSDYPSAKYDTFIEQDGGRELIRELNLPFTSRPTTAQRIAKIELFRSRQDIAYKSDFSTKGLLVQPGDNANLTIDFLGWADKTFEVTEFSLSEAGGALTTNIGFRETAQEIFDWSAGEAIAFDPAPNTNLPNAFLVQPVGVFGLSSIPVQTLAGDTVYKIDMSWGAAVDQFVLNGGQFQIQYKLSSETEFTGNQRLDGTATETELFQSQIDVLYDIRIRAINFVGVKSAWSTVTGFQVGSSLIADQEDWEFETLTRDGDDWENDTLSNEDWE